MSSLHDASIGAEGVINEERNWEEPRKSNYSSASGVIKDGKDYVTGSFKGMSIPKELWKGLKACSLTKPTALLQRVAIPLGTGYDVIIHSSLDIERNTAISLAILKTIDIGSLFCQAVVIAHSEQTAVDLQLFIAELGRFMQVKCLAFTGKKPLKQVKHEVKEGFHVAIGTIKNIYDLITRTTLRIHNIKIFGVKAAEMMASDEFGNGICSVIKVLSSHTQLLFLTSIMGVDILDEFRKFIRYPAYLIDSHDVQILENARYFQVPVSSKDSKPKTLFDLLKNMHRRGVLIFCRDEVEVYRALKVLKNSERSDIQSIVQAGLSEERKKELVKRFCSSEVDTLITTDTLKCSDLKNVSMVINYTFPVVVENFINRTVRGDRSTHKMIIINFITESDKKIVELVENICKTEMEKLPKDRKTLFLNTKAQCHDFGKEENDAGIDLHNTKAQCHESGKNDRSSENQSLEPNNEYALTTFKTILRKELVQGMRENGIKKPTPLQEKAIIPCLNGYDVIIHANRRSSKTSTLAIAILQSIDTKLQYCQALVLAATREMAQHFCTVLSDLGRRTKVQSRAFVGGNPTRLDFRALLKCIHVIVGTAGRIMDLIQRDVLRTDHIKMMVLDEVSGFLSKQQRDQTQEIFNAINSDAQLILSSTISPIEATKDFEMFLKEPLCAVMHKSEKSEGTIKQFFLSFVKEDLTFENISNLYAKLTIPQAVIFCNKKEKIDNGQEMGITGSDFLNTFNAEEKETIVAEVVSLCNHTLFSTRLLKGDNRGQIAIAINYDLLIKKENYSCMKDGRSFLHKGVVVHICAEKDKSVIQRLEDFFGVD